jgi:hypothetical protein
MKKSVLAATAAVIAFTGTASAADMDYDRQVGLIVSGVVDKWAGVQFIDDGLNDDTVFANGGEGRLSLPLGSSLSAQMDAKYEYNSNALEAPVNNDVLGPRYNFQGAFHLSHRDPGSYLFGGLAGVGRANFGGINLDYSFFGGEAQFYMNDITFYLQGGYIDYDRRNGFSPTDLDDGFFARGVMRWFVTSNSRLQLEGTYTDVDYGLGGSMEAFSVGARYDFNVALPIAGETPLYLAYRGTFRDNCYGEIGGANIDDHVFMIGTSYSFNGDMLTVDRQGATLDTPNFNHGCFGQTGQGSDMRLKTDIVALGKDDNGNKIYSWKYKSDPVTTWVGVMAQDLVETHPEALVIRPDGYYAVRYDVIGAQMMTIEQWNNRSL